MRVHALNAPTLFDMATEPPNAKSTPAVALRNRLMRTQTEASLQAGFARPLASTEGILPLYVWAGVEPPMTTPRRCSRGCCVLPASAKFDPHTGAPLDSGARASAVRPPGKGFVLRTA